MSVLLEVSFAFVGVLAIAGMMASWRRYGPQVIELHGQLRRPEAAEEIRVTLHDHALAHARRNRGLLRHMHRPKPVKHRLHGRSLRRAVA